MSGGSTTDAGAGLAARIHAAAHLTGSFKLRSGAVSNEYFDKYAFESDPALLRDVAAALAELVPDDAQALAGLELGGVPLATMVSQHTGLPLLFVRKRAKEYGTCKQVEGPDPAGWRTVVIEDVVTSGGAIVDALPALATTGADVSLALCAIDRESGAAERLAEEGVTLAAAFTMSELQAAAGAG
jgi:orotate phosphoribosyltransferase